MNVFIVVIRKPRLVRLMTIQLRFTISHIIDLFYKLNFDLKTPLSVYSFSLVFELLIEKYS